MFIILFGPDNSIWCGLWYQMACCVTTIDMEHFDILPMASTNDGEISCVF